MTPSTPPSTSLRAWRVWPATPITFMPLARAASATFADASMPRTGIPCLAKYWSRYPSLLAISTTIYFLWVLPASGERFWPAAASVLGLIAVSALWVLFGHTLPIKRRTLRPVSAGVFFAGLSVVALRFASRKRIDTNQRLLVERGA